MVIVDLGFALVLGFLIALILLLPLRRRGPGPLAGFLFYFTLFFIGVWALGIWLTPIGPPVFGAALISFLLGGMALLLFVAAVTEPAKRPLKSPEAIDAEEEAVVQAFSVFFWIVLVVCAVAIVARYLWVPASTA